MDSFTNMKGDLRIYFHFHILRSSEFNQLLEIQKA